ncbi:prepilin-type N-terminal cleavage/methylation domain-containing protein [Hydrogenibacillus schlegelii]|uniref:prepilin-type N-terminal cleavage/methylation domain-containing protein n=1 Tax=Hydrogenibacillus schlegelii TaxID=1484 RepID=UPI002357C923|nr:prepilin-type N-terminal cleavage/methylation domain-containing protein [Hydrogenibacillus schlegelii]
MPRESKESSGPRERRAGSGAAGKAGTVKAGTPSRRDGGFTLLEALVALAVAALFLPLLVRSIGGAHIRLEAFDAAGVRRLEALYAGAYLRGEWVTYADGWTGEKGAGAVDPNQVRKQPFHPCFEEGPMGPVLAADFGGSEAGRRRFELRLDRAADRSATGSYRLRWGKTGEEGTLLEFSRQGRIRTDGKKPDSDRPRLELARFATDEPPSALADGVRVRWRRTTSADGPEEAGRLDVYLAWPVDERWTIPENPPGCPGGSL